MLISLRAALLAAVALLAPFVVGQELPPQLTQQVADLFAGNGSVSSGATVAGDIRITGRCWSVLRDIGSTTAYVEAAHAPSPIIQHPPIRIGHGLVADVTFLQPAL
jgi:predicted RNA methylase